METFTRLGPDWYPSPATCWRRFKEWTESGVRLEAWKRLLEHLDRRQLVKWEQAMADGTFSPANVDPYGERSAVGGGAEVGQTKRGKGSKIELLVDGGGLPLSSFVTSASHAEVNTVETLVDVRVCHKLPDRLISDKAPDADWLRASLAGQGIELNCPHR